MYEDCELDERALVVEIRGHAATARFAEDAFARQMAAQHVGLEAVGDRDQVREFGRAFCVHLIPGSAEGGGVALRVGRIWPRVRVARWQPR